MLRTSSILTILLASVFASGCADTQDQGTVGIAVTDAPVDDYSHVNVTFSRASIHQSGSGADDNDTNSTAGWIEIANKTTTVDLLALHKNQTSEALGFAKVDAGRYTQVRVYVDNVTAIKKDDGSKVYMTVPSNVLRTSKSFEVKAGGNTTLTLEIDLNKSIQCNQQGCKFAPVLGKVEVEESS